MKRISITALFFLGLLITVYPMVTKVYYNYEMSNESKRLNRQFQVTSEEQKQRYIQQEQFNASLVNQKQHISKPSVQAKPIEQEDKNKKEADVIATIRIPKLKLHYPVYNEATPENLNRGVSRVIGTSYPVGGKSTNSVIAAHSYSPFHEWFTHIDRLKNGDTIIVNNFKKKLYYRVYDRVVVSPDQIEAMAIVKGKDIITLLTCTPSGAERLLIYAERTTSPHAGHTTTERTPQEEQTFADKMKVLSESWYVVIIVMLLTALFAYSIYSAEQKKK